MAICYYNLRYLRRHQSIVNLFLEPGKASEALLYQPAIAPIYALLQEYIHRSPQTLYIFLLFDWSLSQTPTQKSNKIIFIGLTIIAFKLPLKSWFAYTLKKIKILTRAMMIMKCEHFYNTNQNIFKLIFLPAMTNNNNNNNSVFTCIASSSVVSSPTKTTFTFFDQSSPNCSLSKNTEASPLFQTTGGLASMASCAALAV
uniref:Uncharacterized protein n=1 Tax=Glossina palpalis gambiensis TaxID=67801 RepID=A0A1B0BS41_9MUSC